MTTYTQNHQLNTELTLLDSEQSPLTIHGIRLSLSTQNDILIESRLTFQVNPELYQRIHNQALFNLQPELRGSFSNGEFDGETNIEITASLKPDLLPNLTPHLDNAPVYLKTLSQEDPNNPLLATESWLGLQVHQQRLPIATGYSTFWDYLTAISGDKTNSEQISDAILKFFQNWAEANLEPIANDAISQALSEVTQGLEEWIDSSISDITSESLTQAISEIANAFEQLLDTSEFDINQDNIASQNIFEAMVNFFTTDDWPYSKIQGEAALQMAFSGKNGMCNCYAKAKEIEKQFVFYSICPIIAPESKLQAMAEFIARANYDMVIGNFELDFNSGEIRYKTSINVEDDKLSFTCIKYLVYTNVTMMDKYLPGIISVINSELLPASAINQIELIQDLLDKQKQFSVDAPADSQEDLELNSSSQSDVQANRLDRESHILSILTPEEIAQFHQVSQMVAPYQRKKVQEITEKLKSAIITRIGELGEEIFTRASTFFLEVKLEAKNFKLIQRYSGLAGRARLLLQRLNNWSKQYGELPLNSRGRIALVELDKLFWRIDERLQKLPTDIFKGQQEVELLIEIEELREQLGIYENLITKIDENPDIVLAST
ncbi:hypothetical protein NIES4074_37160 [Cylindrospermum sp. NIES-4074]|nr:hypothetical protein NIES4074_37160 [Cylindrospermum sp. NIES-4074]